jgi:hypothetical protein
MTTLHIFSNRHIDAEVTNIKKGDWIYLENSLSRKRWSLFFKYINIDENTLNVTYVTQEEYFKLKGTKDNMKYPFDTSKSLAPQNTKDYKENQLQQSK